MSTHFCRVGKITPRLGGRFNLRVIENKTVRLLKAVHDKTKQLKKV